MHHRPQLRRLRRWLRVKRTIGGPAEAVHHFLCLGSRGGRRPGLYSFAALQRNAAGTGRRHICSYPNESSLDFVLLFFASLRLCGFAMNSSLRADGHRTKRRTNVSRGLPSKVAIHSAAPPGAFIISRVSMPGVNSPAHSFAPLQHRRWTETKTVQMRLRDESSIVAFPRRSMLNGPASLLTRCGQFQRKPA
jgi:hypothetical protein